MNMARSTFYKYDRVIGAMADTGKSRFVSKGRYGSSCAFGSKTCLAEFLLFLDGVTEVEVTHESPETCAW